MAWVSRRHGRAWPVPCRRGDFLNPSILLHLKTPSSWKKSGGFTLTEVLVVIAILATLAGVLAPVGQKMLARGRALHCNQNLRQIGIATMSYASDNRMTLPLTSHQRGGKSWKLTLQPYTTDTLVFKCAEDEDKERAYTYLINDFLTPNPAGAPDLNYSILAKIDRPEATMMFAEAASNNDNTDHFHFSDYRGGKIPPAVFEYQVAVEEHAGKANYLFADGHVEMLGWPEVQSRLAADGSTFVDPSAR